MRKQVDDVNQVPAELAEDVFECIHTVMHLYRSQQHRALREAVHELTHMEHKVLGFFGRNPGATPSDLVAYSGRDKAQLARLIRGLRERGLLESRADEEDRRSTRLQLTREGRAVQKILQGHAARISSLAVAGLGEEECRGLIALLERMRANLEAEAE